MSGRARTPALRLPALALLAAVAGCAAPPAATSPPPFADIGYADWSAAEPAYRLYPGDVLDVAALSAPELARTVTVQPDGRVRLPLVGAVMAADRTTAELEAALAAAYAGELRDPRFEVSVKQASPLKIFVGGEVKAAGVYDMPGDLDALQGVILAGGFLPTARRDAVVIIRRGPGGQAMRRTVNLARALGGRGGGWDAVPLRRYDIVYVPRSAVGEVDRFVDLYVRQTLPIQFSYAVGRSYLGAP